MNPAAENRNRWARRDWLTGVLLVLATLLAYQPAWRGEAVFDDAHHLTPPELRSAAGLARIWTDLAATTQYYPLTHSAFWLQEKLWGEAMPGYHLVNILLHAGAALLFAGVLRRLEVPGAWLAAAIFALHPVHAESVAWVSELKNTLSAVCCLGAVLAYLRFDRARAPGAYAGALALFVLGLAAKSVVASLPAALLVVFWWRRGTLSWRSDVVPLLPFFLCGGAAGLFTAWVERTQIGAEGAAFELSLVERGLVAGRAVWFYLGKLVWPAELNFIYPRWNVSAAAAWQYAFPVAALAATAALWLRRARGRGPLAAWLLFGGTLFPVLGFLNVYPFVYSFVADHYQYLASLGAIALAAAGIARGSARFGGWGRAACVALPVFLAGLTWRQSAMYADTETLWRTTLARNPGAWVAHSNLANRLFESGRTDEALAHAHRALELQPGQAELHNNLGHFLLELGRAAEAPARFREALRLRPRFAVAEFNLGVALLRLGGDPDEAERCFARAIEARPDYVRARTVLAGLWLDRGRVDEAVRQLEQALAVLPDDPDANNNLGNARLRQGRVEDAIARYRRALRAAPADAATHHNLAVALTQAGNRGEARAEFRRAVELQPDFVPALAQLGHVLLEDGDAPAALGPLRRAVELAPAHAVALNSLGVALMQTGAVGEATACFRAAVRAQPDFSVAHDNLARALELAGPSAANAANSP